MAARGGQRRLDLLALASFVALGLPDGMLGTAWPSIRQSFGAPVGDLGLILLVSTAGSVLVTVFVGSLIRRLGVATLLSVGLACAAVAAAGFAASPVLGMILAVSLLFGVAAGLMDGGLNTAVGLSGRRRLLNLLHGAYGVGTAIGPLVVILAVLAGSWRPAYLVLLAVDVVLAGLWLSHRQGRRRAAPPPEPAPPEPAPAPGPDPGTGPAPGRDGQAPAPRLIGPIVAGIAVFFVYTGLEVSAGQWETTYGLEHLHLSSAAAGLATFGYWAALTATRIGLAMLPRPPSHHRVVRWGLVLAVVAAALIWWDPATALTITGFVLMGAALAGVFPALIALTPHRLGERRASTVIAWQVGAAAAGGAAVSALVGLLIGTAGIAVLGPAITVLAVLLVALEVLLARLAPAT